MNFKKITNTPILLMMLAAAPAAVGAQEIQAVQSTLDCGQVLFKHPVTMTFKLKNSSPRPLIINDVRTSCGCASAVWPKEPIEGGADFTIEATYDARTMGHFVKQVGVFSNATDKPLMLQMKGVVVDELNDFEGDYPFYLGTLKTDKNDLEFDDVNRGDKPKVEIHIYNPTSESVQPQLQHLPPYLKARVYPAEVAPQHSAVATVTLDSKKLHDFGLTQTSIYLAARPGDRVTPETEITVSSVLLPSFDMTAQQLATAPKAVLSAESFDLGAFKGKKKLKGQIEISNAGQSPLVIRSLQMFTSGLEVKLDKNTIAPGEKTKLRVTAIAEGLKNVRSKPRLLLITNDPRNAKIAIKVNVK